MIHYEKKRYSDFSFVVIKSNFQKTDYEKNDSMDL